MARPMRTLWQDVTQCSLSKHQLHPINRCNFGTPIETEWVKQRKIHLLNYFLIACMLNTTHQDEWQSWVWKHTATDRQRGTESEPSLSYWTKPSSKKENKTKQKNRGLGSLMRRAITRTHMVEGDNWLITNFSGLYNLFNHFSARGCSSHIYEQTRIQM